MTTTVRVKLYKYHTDEPCSKTEAQSVLFLLSNGIVKFNSSILYTGRLEIFVWSLFLSIFVSLAKLTKFFPDSYFLTCQKLNLN